MTGDDRLRAELEALERSAPAGGQPVVEAVRPRPWRRIGLFGATVVAAVALTSLAFGLERSINVEFRSSSPVPSGPSANQPAVAETRVGDFILVISSPKTTWTTDEVVEVTAELRYVGVEPDMTIRQGYPPIGFTLRAASGDGPTLVGNQEQPCLEYAVSASDPLIQTYRKGGVPFGEDGIPVDEAPPFDRAFLDAPDLRMPLGEWRFTAVTEFDERGCGNGYHLEASIVLHVVAPPSPLATSQPSEPGPSETPEVRVCMAALASGVLDADADGNPILIMGEGFPPVAIVFSYPEDFVIESAPVLTIYDRNGNVVAREGDEVELGGGFNAGDTIFYACGFVQPPALPSDDNPTSVSGVLSGDRDLEGGCVWLHDSSGARWEVIWPDGYTDGFRDGVPALLMDGEVVASEGDIVTVTGRRPTGLGSRCMVGTLYEATEVEVP